MERRCRASNLQPSINDIEQDHCEWIIPEEESCNFQYHSPAPQLDPGVDFGTYLMSTMKVSCMRHAMSARNDPTEGMLLHDSMNMMKCGVKANS